MSKMLTTILTVYDMTACFVMAKPSSRTTVHRVLPMQGRNEHKAASISVAVTCSAH